eukprot:COSAG01_NODE_67069_length_268_cov_0.615385_1_plen_42_part_10
MRRRARLGVIATHPAVRTRGAVRSGARSRSRAESQPTSRAGR